MNVSEITFGVEIECYVRAGTITPGGYHRGIEIPGFPTGWNAQSDSSLGYRRGKTAVEIVSPILKGVDGLQQLKTVVAKLKEYGAVVSQRCGFHVHVGVPANDAAMIERLTTLVANHETAIYAATGTKARERGNYCRPIRRDFRNSTINQNGERVVIAGAAAIERFRLLNLTNLAIGTRPAVEFRAFAGTMNFAKMAAYVRVCVGLVERAAKMKRVGKWESQPPVATSPIARKGGIGQTEVVRLSYQLGWTKGRRNETYGDLTGTGLPTIKASKRELMKLAAKYDSQQ
jgi:hypothetical protein